MKHRVTSLFLLGAIAVLLAGCHADVTYKFDVHPNGTVTITGREVIDDQLYQLAASQQNSSDPFGVEQDTRQGWTVSRSTDENENHVITLTKTVSLSDFQSQGLQELPKAPGGAQNIPFDPTSMQKTVGLFTDTEQMTTTIPALMPRTAADSSNPWASMGASMAASVIGIHFELRTPGKVIASNGETTPDGFTRWNINLQSPTDIRYSVQTLDVPHIVVAIAVGLIILLAVVAVLLRRRSTTPLHAESTP